MCVVRIEASLYLLMIKSPLPLIHEMVQGVAGSAETLNLGGRAVGAKARDLIS